jgi:hypothetical protein
MFDEAGRDLLRVLLGIGRIAEVEQRPRPAERREIGVVASFAAVAATRPNRTDLASAKICAGGRPTLMPSTSPRRKKNKA